MMYKAGDKVNVKDGSWSFGVRGGRYSAPMPNRDSVRNGLTVIETGLSVMESADGDREGQYSEICDLLIANKDGGFWFIRSEFCGPVDKEIEIRYFSDGEDVTDRISDETKRNLKTL